MLSLPEIIYVNQPSAWSDPAVIIAILGVIVSVGASLVALWIALYGNKRNEELREADAREQDLAQAMLVVAIPRFDLVYVASQPLVFKEEPVVSAIQAGHWIELENLSSVPVLLPTLVPHLDGLSLLYRFSPDVENGGVPIDPAEDVHILKPGQSLLYLINTAEIPETRDYSIQFQMPSGRWVKKTGSSIEFTSRPESNNGQFRGMFT